MAMTKCQDCRHWQPEPKPGDASFAIIKPGFGLCPLFRSARWEPENQDTLAYAVDDEEYEANVLTNADFGCIMGETR